MKLNSVSDMHCIRVVILTLAIVFQTGVIALSQKIAGPLHIEFGLQEGYTLFAPLTSKNTYLIDNCGRVINIWESSLTPANTVYVLPNGNLLRTTKLSNSVITGGGGGGGVEILDWGSNKLWSFELNNDSLRLHHDVAPLPNGNILLLVWELRKGADALAQGADPARLPATNVVWSEQIIEVKPVSLTQTEIVWKWSLWDHLIQDYDNSKNNFGVVAEHPELVDLNFISDVTADWIHANSIDYNAELDQIVISSPFLNELWIIDHSTTTQQAAGHSGGNSGKGGDLLYRWGNPQAYGRGGASDQKLFFQHDVHWIKEGPYEDKIILFNNQRGSNFSSVDVISPPIDSDGKYNLVGNEAFGPSSPMLEYVAAPVEELYSQNMSSAQALENGHLLICSSRQGFFYEVDPVSGDRFWHYRSPITAQGIVGRDLMTNDPNYPNDIIFRTWRYPLDYPAFSSRIITPAEPIEGEPWAPCDLVTGIEEQKIAKAEIKIYPSPFSNQVTVALPNPDEDMLVSLLTIQGNGIRFRSGRGTLTIDTSDLPSGMYFVVVNGVRKKVVKLGVAN